MTKPQEDMALYTPVVFPEDSNAAAFESSLPSLSSISGFSPNLTYLEDLQRKHHALAQIVREEPPTPPRLPSSDNSEDEDGHGYEEATFLAAREERIAALKQRVREAFIEADGNPADGKWALVARLLKMESTSGQYGRWSGTRTDRRPPEPLEGDGIGWINAKTEVEWNEWEKKYLEERRLKDKVENWQRRVLPPSKGPSLAIDGHPVGSVHVDVGVPVPNEPSTSNQAEQPQAKSAGTGPISQIKNQLAAASSLTDPLRDAAPFGFGVVKRASQNTNSTGGKPSKPTGNGNHRKQPSADHSNGPPGDEVQPEPSPSKNKDKDKETAVQRIGDFPDASSADRPNGPPGGDVQPEPSSSKNKDKNKETEVHRIDDLPDASFLPSFSSSQVLTSTPKPAAKRPLASSSSKAVIGITNSPPQRRLQPQGTHIPAPLFPFSPTQSPSSVTAPRIVPPEPVSPRVTKTYGRHTPAGTPMRTPLDVSASLPAIHIPTTPTRKRHAAPPAAVNAGAVSDSPPTVINANNKREREPTFTTPRRHDEQSTSNANANAPLTPNANANQNQNQREEEDVERALKRARTLSAYELLTSPSPGPGMGDNRNKSPYHQTLTGFALAAAAASRSPRTPKAAAHHVTPIASRSEGAGIGSPSTPTPTPGPMRGTRAQTSSGVPLVPAAQAPSTPPPPARADKLPTLTELLASDRKKEKKKKVRTSVLGSTSVSALGVKPPSSPTKGKGKFAVEPIREVPESDLEEGWVGGGAGAGAIASASAHVEAIADAAAATTGESECQVQAEIQNEPQSAQSLDSNNTNSFPHRNNSYPNAPAYSYPITEDNRNFLHPHSLLDLVDPHADVDPYADPPPPVPELDFEREFHREIERDSIFGGEGGYDPYDVDVDLASPAKSLSSIAGSDDDDSEEEVDQLAGDLDIFGSEGRLGKGFEFRPLATSTQQGPFRGAGAGAGPATTTVAATANAGVDAPRPGISQGSKDSWESVYAPKSSTGDAPTSASHRPQNGSHPSSPRSNSNSQVSSSSHLHPRHALTPSSSNPFARVDYARTPSSLNALAHRRGLGHGHLQTQAQAQVQAHIRTPSSSDPFKYTYNSQFESNVAKEVEKVNKLLESEIKVDYDGWLRDPDEDEGDESKGVEESP